MKKSILLGMLGLAVTTLSSYGQGVIVLDNYDSYGPYVTYGDAVTPANGVSGTLGVQGTNVKQGAWTVGVYFAIGSVSVPTDPTHVADPSTLGLTLGTGAGSSGTLADSRPNNTPGEFLLVPWNVPGSLSAGGQTITLEIVAYSGVNYDSSTYKGHSEAFTMTTSANGASSLNITGFLMPGFSVFAVPEPSVLALSGLGAAALMAFRRKNKPDSGFNKDK